MTDYHRMGIAAKQAHQRAAMREPAVVCPVCETQTTAADLVEHATKRCPGRRDPHPHSSWIGWRDVLAMGVPKRTLTFWARRGEVRATGEPGMGRRRYLQRDVAQMVARRSAQRAAPTSSTDGDGSLEKKILTRLPRRDPSSRMQGYEKVQVELDSALTSRDPAVAAAACRRAQIALARVATGAEFDPRRHRAIAAALRDARRSLRGQQDGKQ